MTDTNSINTVRQVYIAFNARDVDGAVALMTQDVSWPKAAEGGTVVGPEAVRAYWTRQWAEFDPHVDPLALVAQDGGKVRVQVHQVVQSLEGQLLFEGEVVHLFTVVDGLIAAMDLGGEAGVDGGPSAAFAHRA